MGLPEPDFHSALERVAADVRRRILGREWHGNPPPHVGGYISRHNSRLSLFSYAFAALAKRGELRSGVFVVFLLYVLSP
jgi:hypothetical protein